MPGLSFRREECGQQMEKGPSASFGLPKPAKRRQRVQGEETDILKS